MLIVDGADRWSFVSTDRANNTYEAYKNGQHYATLRFCAPDDDLVKMAKSVCWNCWHLPCICETNVPLLLWAAAQRKKRINEEVS